MSYQAYAQRRAALDTVLTHIERDGQVLSETELSAAAGDASEVLATAQQRWHSHLGARIDAALETGAPTPERAVSDAYRETARSLPTLRRLLDSHADHPVVQAAQRQELALLAQAAQLTSAGGPQAAGLGRELRDRIAATELAAGRHAPRSKGRANSADQAGRRAGWLCRLRQRSAA
ncbi:MAG: hypothetical protein ACRDTQ_02815 [Micromonosporaceae bacterium]